MEETMIGECENCGFESIEVTKYNILIASIRERKDFWLCEICSLTFLGRATTNLNTIYSENAPLFKSIAWIANRLLLEIKNLNKKGFLKDE